ncbi:fatty acid hydroxylase [Caminibacter mediatlanticus TB-2]|uniref:Fatty acid hydroxylase n=1 Tax=Caminibacter mediatlanticus TB-2 TaxID=391592 RepID=A0AAI9AII0_9BACT|nr:sterol desaturase family protein [Caminibacter mediatlanticus]EDM24293.1 possible fatty acid hydroxylase [Caminibacter mediatlanticus TB-2]QCT94938.1 fatty acid hydroxylase [Caminibacter mediatlanticus TB-2]
MKEILLKITSSKINYYLSLLTDLLTAVIFLSLSLYYSKDIFASLALFVVGVIFFTFLEYAVHAWLFHKNHPLKIFIEGHANHHRNPFSYDAMPFFMSLLIASVFAYLLHFIMPLPDALAIVGGMTLGYFNYGIMHHIMHRVEFKDGYWRYMQEFHFVHHKKPKMNHGVTTDIWDRVFGTYYVWSEEDLKGIEKLKRVDEKRPLKAIFDLI